MHLSELYKTSKAKNLKELAEILGVSDNINPSRLVQRWMNGTSFPRKHHLLKIYRATNGQVTPTDFITDKN